MGTHAPFLCFSASVFHQLFLHLVKQEFKTFTIHMLRWIGRPKRLFVLVNPFGGKRCANKIYEAEVKPMLETADVDVTMQGFSTQMRIVFSMIQSIFFLNSWLLQLF
jgi:hypothetical protein